MRALKIALVAAAATGIPVAAHATDWDIDPGHSSAMFRVRLMMVQDVRGELGQVSGVVHLNEQDVTRSSVEASIDVQGLSTRQAERDTHIKGAEFLDAAKFPRIRFQSSKVERAGAGKLRVQGELTIRGVTRQVVLDLHFPPAQITDPDGNQWRSASATTKLSRNDFGLTWAAPQVPGGTMLGDEVAVVLDIEHRRSTATARAR